MKIPISTIAGVVLAAGVVVVLAVADAHLFEDAEITPLYKTTLDQAYNRFRDSDVQVPAGGGQAAGARRAVANPQTGLNPRAGQRSGTAAQMFQRMQAQAQARAGQPVLPAFGGGSIPGAVPGQPGAAGQHTGHIHDDGGVHTAQGKAHMAAGRVDQAIAEFRLALLENPTRFLAHHYIGDALRAKGQDDEAIAAYQEVLEILPYHYCCYVHMGDIERDRGQLEAAEELYASAVSGYREQMNSEGTQATVARYQLGKFFLDHDRNLAEATTLAEQAAAAQPPQAAYLLLLARCYEKAGRQADAVGALDRAVALNPQHKELYADFRRRLLTSTAAVGPPGSAETAPASPPAEKPDQR